MTTSAFVNINPVTPSSPNRISIKNGGAITLDQTLPNYFTCIRISSAGTEGDIVVQNTDDSGVPYTYTVVNCTKAQGYIWCVGNKILSAGTTAAGIYWYVG